MIKNGIVKDAPSSDAGEMVDVAKLNVLKFTKLLCIFTILVLQEY